MDLLQVMRLSKDIPIRWQSMTLAMIQIVTHWPPMCRLGPGWGHPWPDRRRPAGRKTYYGVATLARLGECGPKTSVTWQRQMCRWRKPTLWSFKARAEFQKKMIHQQLDRYQGIVWIACGAVHTVGVDRLLEIHLRHSKITGWNGWFYPTKQSRSIGVM